MEKLVLAYTEALTETPTSVDDTMRAELKQHFSPKQIVELTHAIAWENARARFNRGFNIQPDGYQ